jgi:hypothetical protein
MTDVRALIQLTLDNRLASENIYSYWGEKKEVPGETDMYVVYNVSNDSNPDYADNKPLSRVAYCIIGFYYSKTLAATYSGRSTILGHVENIKSDLRNAGFTVSSFDDNDPDDNVYSRIVIEAEYAEVI